MAVHPSPLTRSGSVWVGVSAQRAGSRGGGYLRGDHLHKVDPNASATLHHPGDAYPFDIFSQAATAVRSRRPARWASPTTVLGTGTSQSAMYLVTYINAIDPTVQVFDGFLIHGRGVRGAWVEGRIARPTPFRHRSDPVLAAGRRPAAALGTRRRGALRFLRDPRRIPRRWLAATGPAAAQAAADVQPIGFRTSAPSNSGPQLHYVLQAAVEGLRRWVVDAVPPASARVLATRRFQPLRLSRDGTASRRRGPHPLGVGAGGHPVRARATDRRSGDPARINPAVDRRRPGAPLSRRKIPIPRRVHRGHPRTVRAGFLLPDDESEIRSLAAVSWPADQPAEPTTRPRSRPDRLTTTRH